MRKRWCLLAAAFALLAQQPPAELPPPQEEKPAGPPAYVYQGKPLVLPLACGEKEIEEFGLTCTEEEPCDVYLELAGVEEANQRIFLTGNLHTSTTTLFSVLLKSEDGGVSWTEPMERMRFTGLEQIQFVDLEYGWIGGQQLQALPRDPFLLLTTDGGVTWRKRPVSGESRVGAIEQFYFEDRKNGYLLVDRTQSGDSGARHEYYETTTGGDSWGLRQVSPKPIALKRTKPPSAVWRIRTDARTKSFRLERRSGQAWQTVAAFLVKVGECKAAAFELKEPPPPPASESKPDITVVVPGGGKTPRKPPTLRKKK